MTELKSIRWWPGVAILLTGGIATILICVLDVWPYEQKRMITLLMTVSISVLLMLIWWLFLSRASGLARAGVLLLCVLPFVFFRIRGMTGDFRPIIEFRFAKKSPRAESSASLQPTGSGADFPQILGPNRDARLDGPALDPDWNRRPPQILWRHPVGPAWSGFAIGGTRTVTLEQEGGEECVTCYDLLTGRQLWKTANAGHYRTTIAGEGPRTVPTISDGRVFTLGATGTLRCLEIETGKAVWTRDITRDAGVAVPEWGFASSPLLHEGKVIVSAGSPDGKSLLAYDVATGTPAWSGGNRPINYSSPFLLTLAGRRQIVMFNSNAITSHDPATGAVLWEHPWGQGLPNVARPIPVGENRVLFSSGYSVGSALLEIAAGPDGKLAATQVWKTIRFQAKFSNPAERGGHVYGVSDGIFACLDLADGAVKWKGGRYGHGQGLLVGEHYLQMTENPGELVLLRPTPQGPNELARFPVFDAKTWNPIALSGDLLLVRNDGEAACIRLPLAK